MLKCERRIGHRAVSDPSLLPRVMILYRMLGKDPFTSTRIRLYPVIMSPANTGLDTALAESEKQSKKMKEGRKEKKCHVNKTE